MTRVETPQSRCRAGFARADITPPAGIYHRTWGAAPHDRATGVHRPLSATALCLEPLDGGDRQLVVGVDHCLLDAADMQNIREKAARAGGMSADHVRVCLSHTHAAGWLSRSRENLPGGELIAPYLDRLADTCATLAKAAAAAVTPATMVFGTARCSLAGHRDFWDGKQFVCGFNPAGPADDTVVVARVAAKTGQPLGTIVNYACHPTTLAWENSLVSPDFVGAMREVVEQFTGVPCLFLQGASGDLGPREGFVGDPVVADRNGRQLGFAALSGLEALPPATTAFEYAGPVVSGALLGTWQHRPAGVDALTRYAGWECRRLMVNLAYRTELPTADATRAELDDWEAAGAAAASANDPNRVRECRAMVEQKTRQLARLASLPPGKTYPLPVTTWRLGDALWVFVPGELDHVFQTTLRSRYPNAAVVVATLADDWQPGYVPAAASYGYGIYQDVISPVAAGSLEVLTEAVSRELRKMWES